MHTKYSFESHTLIHYGHRSSKMENPIKEKEMRVNFSVKNLFWHFTMQYDIECKIINNMCTSHWLPVDVVFKDVFGKAAV